MVSDESPEDKTQSFIALTSGTVVFHYRIIDQLGSGGMGEVYLALDTRLHRRVALKFLPPHLCQDEDCRKRFTREAQAAAGLDHPNVAAIYEVGDFHGRPFYAMQVVEGQSLKDIIAGKDLSVDRILEIGIQVCEGLQAAHHKGIIHRDIKPSNILLDSHGRVRIIDFGLAAIRGSEHLTKTGSTLGTIGYMSPEQVQSKETDHRSDLFSLGVVLSELITKHNPFMRDSEAATLKAVSDDLPEPLARFKSGLPEGLQSVIDKALEKEPRTRYQHADGMLSDLMRVKRSLESRHSNMSGLPRSKNTSRTLWALVAVIVAVAVTLVLTKPWHAVIKSKPPEKIKLAVLPFDNLGDPEDEYFADGITEEIIGKLSKLSGLAVISRTSSMQYKDNDKSLRQIGKELGVEYVLEGTVRWVHANEISNIRVQPQLIRVDSDVHVWASSYDAIFDNVLTVQSDIATAVASALDLSLQDSDRSNLAPERDVDPETYNLYLKGRDYRTYDVDRIQAAIGFLKQAVERDPDFAPAHARLAAAMVRQFLWFGEHELGSISPAREHAERAIELDSTLAEGYVALAEYLFDVEHDPGQAMYYFQLASEREPDNADVLAPMGMLMFREGQFEAARRYFERVAAIDPAQPQRMLATMLEWQREWQSLEDYYDRLIPFYPDSLLYQIRRAWAIGCRTLSLDSLRVNLPDALYTTPVDSIPFRWWDYLLYVHQDEMVERAARARLEQCRLAVDSATTYLLLAVVYYLNDNGKAAATSDTAIAMHNRFLENESQISLRFDVVQSQLAMAYALRGETRIADSLCREVLARIPPDDRSSLSTILNVCAYALAITDQRDLAIDILDQLMSRPSNMSLFALLIDRGFDPLRDHPRFQALIEKYEKEHEL